MHGQHDHAGITPLLLQPSKHLQAIQPWHRHIGDDDVGAQANRVGEQPGAVADGSDDVELVLQEGHETVDDDRVIVGNQHGGAALGLFHWWNSINSRQARRSQWAHSPAGF